MATSTVDGKRGTAGDRWGERPGEARQKDLEAWRRTWERKSNRREKGPFTRYAFTPGERLSGADVFWLAVLAIPSSGCVLIEGVCAAVLIEGAVETLAAIEIPDEVSDAFAARTASHARDARSPNGHGPTIRHG
jgi:hypothetical protein